MSSRFLAGWVSERQERERARVEKLERALRAAKPTRAESVLREIQFGKARNTDPWQDDRISLLLQTLEAKAPKTFKVEKMPQIVTNLASRQWRKRLESWEPKGKSARTQMDSLISHLWCEYPMPKFLFEILEQGQPGQGPQSQTEKDLVEFFYEVSGGYSAFKAAQVLIKTPLSKKQVHAFMQATSNKSVIQAIREVQVFSRGGSNRLAAALNNTRLGRGFQGDEEFWDTVIHWFCNQGMLDPQQVAPLIDYIGHCNQETPGWVMKGRTVESLSRDMERWHGVLQKLKRVSGSTFKPSGYAPGIWEVEDSGRTIHVYKVVELLSPKELEREGVALKHCVYSYGRSIEVGRTSIWSFQTQDFMWEYVKDENGLEEIQRYPVSEPVRKTTIEVWNKENRVVQVASAMNRLPEAWVMRYVQDWAAANNLSVYEWNHKWW